MEVIVYSSNRCGFCAKQNEYLTENGVVFEEKDINNAVFFQELKELGGTGVPFTIVKKAGGNVSTIAGFDREKLSEILIQQ
ncbi:glutaredoxin family protein [Lysinibacillus sp. NPDC097214]|uniref:glutaredoxin family protein n=1 Tax=Lysinibacillus sp. NPDC097214 TaxID=3390584 RepID=UPI003D085440